MPKVSETILVDAEPKLLYEVAFDFEKYPDFLPDVKAAKVDGKKGKGLLVDFEISVIKTIRYTLNVTGVPHKKISWSLVKGDLFKKNDGGWSFEKKGDQTRATYTVDIEFGIFVPSLITKKLVGSNLPGMMERFKERAESLS